MTPTQRNDIAGAIFDFAVFLTAHKEVIAVGSTSSASPMVLRIQEWAEARGLSLEAPNFMAWNDSLSEPAPEPVGYEQCKAIQESERNAAETNYFKARPQIDCIDRRNVFCAGFDRGFDAQKPAPVREPAPVQELVCRGCGIPINDIHMSTCPTKKWPMRVDTGDAAQPAPVQEPHKDLADAYCGAREDLAIWKKRALEAESELRNEIDSSHRLISELNAQNGPSHMGDPVCKPVQEPVGKGLFVDLIAQHPGLAEELKAIDDAPLPAWIPPRLTDGELNELYSKWAMGKRDGTTFTDVIQDAVRSQFASQQPRKAVKLSEETKLDICRKQTNRRYVEHNSDALLRLSDAIE